MPGSPPAAALPTAGGLVLHPVYPNPFNPAATIRFNVQHPGTATITIYDVAGRLVRSLIVGEALVGRNTKTWNGLDDEGNAVSSGLYFVRVST
jgi:hypothetical protein